MITRVVVADDAPDVRLLLKVMLSMDPDIELVAEATTPNEAIMACKEHLPDVVICDHSFESEVTGIDIAPVIRQNSPLTKFVLFSAFDNLHDRIAQTPEIDAFVLKTDATKLTTVIKTLV